MTERTLYRIPVDGHRGAHWSTSLANLVLAQEQDGTTMLTGPMTDQVQLHGLLARIRALVRLVLLFFLYLCETPPSPSPRSGVVQAARKDLRRRRGLRHSSSGW